MRTLLTPIRLNPFGPRPGSLYRAITDSGLPAPLQSLIHDVVRRTKLWHSERLDVARELIAHFHDGLAAGMTPESLIETFGDRSRAASLILRAKKRCRPRAWRAMTVALKGVAVLCVTIIALFIAFAARAFLSSPTITRNYLAEINAPITKLPGSDRAWPVYRQAYLAQPRMPTGLLKSFPPTGPQDPLWSAGVEFIKGSTETLELLRVAAQRPVLGLPLSNVANDVELEAHQIWMMGESTGVDADKALAMAKANADSLPKANNPNPALITVLLPHLGTMRHFARLLVFDARQAADAGDAGRAHADLQALYRLAAHSREHGFLISGLVSLAIHDLASAQLGRILRDQPSLLSEEQLTSLAHLASTTIAPIDFSAELLSVADVLQRAYSDNGHGDGHLTAEGIRQLAGFIAIAGQPSPEHDPMNYISIPAISGLSPSRREVSEAFDSIFARANAYAATRPWERDDRNSPDFVIGSISFGTVSRVRNAMLLALTPAFNSSIGASDRAAQTNAGILTAVSLELYKRQHGAYPATLADIDAALLPKVPIDMFDGRPIRYALREGKPILYSIGTDRKDDGGRPPEKINYSAGSPAQWMSDAQARAALADPLRRPAIDGDWILWPLPPESIVKSPE